MPTDPKLLEQLNRKIRNTGFEEKAAWSTADYIRETALDIPRGLAGGVVGFTQSAGSLLDAGFEAVGLEGFDDEILSSSYRPDSIRTKTVFGGFVDTTAQFVTGLVLGGGALKVTGAARGAAGLLARSGRIGATIAESKIAKAAGYGAVADFLAFQGDEGRAADFLVGLGGVGDNVVTRYLATDKEDPWLEARFKNVVEGALLGVAFDTALKGVGAAIQSGVVQPLEARRALREMFPEMSKAELKKLDEAIPSEIKGSGPDEDELDEFIPDEDEFDEIIDEPLDEEVARERITADVDSGVAAGLTPEEALQEGFNLHINYRHILNTEDAVKAMRAAEKVAEDIINTRIGDVQSNAETARLATEMGLDPEQLINALKTNADATRNAAAQYVAGRSLRSAFAEQAASLAQRFEAVARGEVDGDAVALQEELLKATSALINVDTIVGEVQKQAARVVQAGNIDVGDAADLAAVDADDILAAIRGEATPGAEAAMRAAQKAADEGNAALAEILREVAEESAPALPPAPTRTGGTPDAPAADATTPPAGPAAAPPSQAAPTGAAPQTGTAAPSQPSQGAAPAAAPTAGGAPTGQTPTQGAAPAPIAPQIPAPRPAQGRVNPQTVRLAGAIAQAHRTGQTARIVKQAVQAKKAGIFDVFLEYYKASILSGIPTFMINGVSGGLNTMLQAAARLAGSAASLDWKETQRSFKLMVNVVGAMGDLVKYTMFTTPGDGPKGLRTVARTIATEKPTLTEATAIEGVQAIKADTFGLSNQGIAGKSVNAVGRFIRLPFAVNQAGEEMWSQLNYLAFIRTKAAEAADTAIWKNAAVPVGQKEAAALAFVDAYIKDAFDSMGAAKVIPPNNPRAIPKFLHEDAVKYAQSVNYTQDLVAGLGQSLTKLKQDHRWMDLIIPFIKAPTNLVRQGIRMTPGLHLLDRRFAKRFLSRNQDEVMRARGELLLGSALWGTAVYLSATGQITGGGPLNREERAALMATGWRPYSFVKVKADGSKEYVEYRRFDPLAMVFGISADFAEAGAYLQDSERDAFGKAAVLALANNITSKTYLQGLSETIRAITRPDMSGGQYLKNRIGALVPTFFARYATSDDQYMREARSVLDAMRRRIPGLSQDLPPRRNILGEPVTPTAGFIPFTNTTTQGTANQLSRMMSPAGFSRSVNDVVVQELASLSYGFSMPSVRMDGVDLTTVRTPSGQEAYDRYVELSGTVKLGGKTLSERLSAVINSSSYQKLPMPQSRGDALNPRIQTVQRVIAAYRSRAKGELMRESPELRDAIFEIRRTARVGGSKNPILERLQAQ
jgi:hypothetical protein